MSIHSLLGSEVIKMAMKAIIISIGIIGILFGIVLGRFAAKNMKGEQDEEIK